MKKTTKILTILTSAIIVIVGAILLSTYVFNFDSPAITTVRKALHLPAIVVDGHWISIGEIEENTASIKQFYENQDFSKFGVRIDFDTEDGKKRLLLQQRKMINKLIEDIAIKEIAKEWGITISDEAVKTAMERPMAEMGTKESVQTRLENLYGWTLDDFGKKVVYGQLLREKVAARFDQTNEVTDEMRTRIKEAKKELDDGRDFADVAAKYSDGATASEGGVMGWFADGQLQDAIGKQIFSMEKGEYSDIIETPLGLHIVHVNEVADVDGKKLVHISQIVVKKKTFVDFLDDKIKSMNVKVFLPEYEWDAQKGLIVFTDENMDMFERQMGEEAQNLQEKFLPKEKGGTDN